MPPLLLPEWVIAAILIAGLSVYAHVKLVKQGRLRGHSIVTYFCAMTALICAAFIEFYVPVSWHGGAKFLLIIACYVLMALFMAVTKKLPAAPPPRRWRKTIRHD